LEFDGKWVEDALTSLTDIVRICPHGKKDKKTSMEYTIPFGDGSFEVAEPSFVNYFNRLLDMLNVAHNLQIAYKVPAFRRIHVSCSESSSELCLLRHVDTAHAADILSEPGYPG
jgi:hypothetical protein